MDKYVIMYISCGLTLSAITTLSSAMAGGMVAKGIKERNQTQAVNGMKLVLLSFLLTAGVFAVAMSTAAKGNSKKDLAKKSIPTQIIKHSLENQR